MAQWHSERRTRRPKTAKLITNDRPRQYVQDKLPGVVRGAEGQVVIRPAGREKSYAAAIRHTGRKSGKQYSTPVGAQPVPDGFIIPLAYGTKVDWLQNVFAAGRAMLSANGETHDVTKPELIDASTALPMISPKQRRAYESVGISQYLKVKLAESY